MKDLVLGAKDYTANISLTAVYTVNTYAITYDLVGGVAGTSAPTTHTYDSATTVSNPTKFGYTFVGWLVNGGTQKHITLTLGAKDYTSNIALTANWTLNTPTATLTADRNNIAYDGKDFTLTASATHTIVGATYTYAWYKDGALLANTASSFAVKNVSDSGKYSVKVTAKVGAHSSDATAEVTLMINRAQVDVSLYTFADLTVVYDGQLHSVTVSNLDALVAVAYADNTLTDVGVKTASATFTLTDTANYEFKNSINTKTATLTVNKAQVDVSLYTFADLTVVYDGQLHSVIVSNLDALVTVAYADNTLTNAGVKTASVTFTLIDTANYEFKNSINTKTATLTVNKAQVDVSLYTFADLTIVYDGQLHSVTVSNLDALVTVAYADNTLTNVGVKTAKVTFALTDTANYEFKNSINTKTATLTVNKATPTYTAPTFTNVYIGQMMADSMLVGGVGDGAFSIDNKVSFVSGVNNVSVTFKPTDNNYNSVNFNVSVTPIQLYVTLVDDTQVDRKIAVAYGGTLDKTAYVPLARTGYSVAWDNVVTANITSDITVTAVYTANTYTITYDFVGGVSGASAPTTHTYDSATTVSNPTKLGYTFVGWLVNGAGNNVKDLVLGAKDYTANISLTAVYTVNTYTITYDLVGGVSGASAPTTHTYDSPTTISNPSKVGYTFVGWLVNGAGNSVKDLVLGAKDYTANISLTAVYTANTYNVIFVGGAGASGTMPSQQRAYDAPLALSTNLFTKTGYTFNGWATTPNGTMAYSDNQSLINQLYNNGQDVTLYAVFTAVEYKVEFYSGLGATGSQAGIGTKHIGDTFALPTCTYTAPANKRFSSWSDGTTTYLVGAIFTMPASDVAFTAMWEVDTYSVSFDVTGATSSNAPLPQQKNEGDTITIPYGIYKDDNAFCGWNDGAKTYAVGDVYTMPAKSVIFTAVWKQATVGLVYTSISADTAYSVKGDSATIGSALDVVIPSSHLGKPVTMVAISGFNGSNSAIYKTLTSIHIGYGVTTIGQEAFYRCDGVTSIDIPKTVNDIGREAFGYCARLLAITIPEGVTQLRFNVLSDCYSLSAVSIPSSVTMINRTALDWCGQLTTITVASGNTFYKVVSGCLISLQDVVMEDDIYETVPKGTLIRGTLNSVIPTDGALVNRIGYTAFRYSGIQSIVIPSNITILESYCFNYAESLTSVILHEGLITIGSQAFRKCTALTSIIIPASVIDMRSNVFANSPKLTHIYCRIAQEPTSGWEGSWNYKISGDPNQGYIPVTWGYTGA